MDIFADHGPLTTEENGQPKPKREAIMDILKIAGPWVVFFICGIGMCLVNTAVIGHIGTEA